MYSQAADENENDNYEKALSLHKKALWLNGGGFVFIMIFVLGFFLVGIGGGVVVSISAIISPG